MINELRGMILFDFVWIALWEITKVKKHLLNSQVCLPPNLFQKTMEKNMYLNTMKYVTLSFIYVGRSSKLVINLLRHKLNLIKSLIFVLKKICLLLIKGELNTVSLCDGNWTMRI